MTENEDREVIWVTPQVSGVNLKMELDTGSALSVISNADYKRLFPDLPAIWQRAMDQVLQDIPSTQCYLDEIIVTGKNDKEHLEKLGKVLTRLSEHGLHAKRSKCEFFKSEISYCGHVIDRHGLHKSKEKI